jgi:hypothetical protein
MQIHVDPDLDPKRCVLTERLSSTDSIDRELSAVSWRSTPPLPHLWDIWALEAPLGALVHKTTYAPMIYTALYVMFLMCADPYLGKLEGVGSWKSQLY